MSKLEPKWILSYLVKIIGPRYNERYNWYDDEKIATRYNITHILYFCKNIFKDYYTYYNKWWLLPDYFIKFSFRYLIQIVK